MAEKKKEAKVVLERVYTVPLRSEWLKAPKYRRAKKAGTALREFVEKHMKSKDVKIGKYINEFIWQNGIKSPPHHVRVECKKDSDGIVFVEMVGAPKEKPVEKKEKKVKKGKITEDLKDKVEKKLEESSAEIKEEKAEKAKEVQKEEIKELAKVASVHPPRESAKSNAPKGKRMQRTIPKEA